MLIEFTVIIYYAMFNLFNKERANFRNQSTEQSTEDIFVFFFPSCGIFFSFLECKESIVILGVD